MFGRGKVSGLADIIPHDPREAVVDEIYRSYPFGKEGMGLRSWVRLIVFTVVELKKRGLI